MGRIWLVPVFLAIWVSGVQTADACGCAPRSASCGPPADFWRADAVFTGRVAAISRAASRRKGGERHAVVLVQERFRGSFAESKGEVLIRLAPVCSYRFRTGRTYLIYASRAEGGGLTVSVCSRTLPIDRAGADLVYARAASRGEAGPGRIVGHVREAVAERSPSRPLAGVVVTAALRGTRWSAATDERGRYTIERVGAGTYTMDAALPAGRFTPQAGRSVELLDPRACVQADIDVRYDGRITGRVVDAQGRGVAGLTVAHRPVVTGSRIGEPARTVTSDDGSYRFERLAPGRFVIAVELPLAESSGESADGLAIAATLGAGERRSLEPLRLSASVPLARLEGTVHTSDGAPAPGAHVFLRLDGAGPILVAPAVTDALGRFVLAAVDGAQYEVFASLREHGRPASQSAFSTPLAVTASVRTPPLRLVVRPPL